MSRIFVIGWLVAVATLTARLGAQDFEGVVSHRTVSISLDALADRGIDPEDLFDMSVEDILAMRSQFEPLGQMTVEESETLLKGNLMRTDASDEEGPAYAIVDVDTGVVRVVRLEEGMYLEVKPEDLEEMGSMAGFADYAPPEIAATGASRSINGMTARELDVTYADEQSRAWITTDHPDLRGSIRSVIGAMNAMNMEEPDDLWSFLLAEHGMPVLTQTLGWDDFVLEEITSVAARTVPADAFSTPDGLERVTLQDMMGAMAGVEYDIPSAGAAAGGMGFSVWIEYEVTGALEVANREEDVVLCSWVEDGFEARSIGEVVIGLESDATSGTHDASLQVDVSSGRYEGRGVASFEEAGTDPMGMPVYLITFEGVGLTARSGGSVDLSGSMSCSVM